MEYYEKLRDLRIQSNMSQEQLAELLHVTRQTVSKWEQGVNQPDIYTLKQYASIFNVSLDELIGDGINVKNPGDKRRLASKCLFVASTLLFVFCVLTAFIFWRFLQDTMPGHYNIHGEIDRYANKSEILLHLLSFAVYYIVALCLYLTGRRNVGTKLPNTSSASFIVLFSIVLAIQLGYLIFVLCFYAPYLVSEGVVSFVYCEASALILVVAIATHPKITPQNFVMGMRTNFTMTNVDAWKKINNVSSICISLTALIMIAINMIFVQFWVALASPLLLIVTVAIVFIYHEIVRKQMQN